ncbi:MAG: Ig-like domain-containing protein [Solirubrobacterales bacterium]
MIPSSLSRKLLPLLGALCLLGVVVLASTASGASTALTYEELPDPLEDGSYTVKRVDPIKLGTYSYDEPSTTGGAATGSNEPLTNAQIRGVLYQPEGYSGKSPLIVFVHGNHSSCDVSGTSPNCTTYKRNDEGYAYMGENLASWGYTVFSVDQDQLMLRQDSYGKGMHARRLLIMAALTKLKEASEVVVPETENSNVGELLTGKLDMTRIGLMGHSRGGDAVSSFVTYDQTLPVGERFPLRAVVSIAPVDYERHAPYGVPYMTVFGSCDGDVSNLQGARLYERSQYESDDPYPRFQVVQVGGNHDAYNTVWQADGDDAEQKDAACGPDAKGGKGQTPSSSNGEVENVLGTHNTEDPFNIRLSGEAGQYFEATEGEKPYRWGNTEKLNPLVNTRISGEASRMGDQEKMGLATVAAFFRRYVGGEGAFEPYLTGELAAEEEPSIPQSACPTSEAGERIPCIDRVADSYTAAPEERLDVLRPDTEHPTTVDALGTKIEASGFSNPYQESGGVQPVPTETANGITWCDPDPEQAEPTRLGEGTYPTAAKWCPQPAKETLGGQGTYTPESSDTESAAAAPREQAPVNGSYGRQLSLAWEEEADLGISIPAADEDVSGYKALYMATAVNFFDTRNPSRGTEGRWNPEYAPQNFTIAVTDAEGNEATVEADDARYGTATQQTLGSTSDRVHVLLKDLRVPLADFEEQGVNLTELRKLELRFGEEGMPESGSIQLADVRFQQPVSGYSDVLLDSTEPNAGPGEGEPTSGPNPVEEMEEGVYKRADGSYEIPNVTKVAGANVWTVDDDQAQCPNAQFTTIQEAVEYANAWDTIVVCPGVYEESSTPVNSTMNPVAEGAVNGLTIKKPLKIIGAGAEEVTIKPSSSLTTLAGSTARLRDGGGNVITVSRQSLGSSEYDEEYVDISGVTIESGSTEAEAGVAFFNASGRIADSVVSGGSWGVVETNSMLAAGEGTPERQVTIEDSKISGYGSGGVLFDASKGGVDGAAGNTERSGENQVGYIKGSTIEGSGGTASEAQTGVAYRSGAHGEITDSAILDNQGTTGTSYGILAADAGSLSVEESEIAGNGGSGYGLYNGNADATEVSTGEAIAAEGDYWGTGGTPIEGETVLGPPDEEGYAGPADVTPVASSAPVIPSVPSLMPDAAPVGEIVNPAGGEYAEVGVATEPVVLAEDDYGVSSVSLEVDGVAVETIEEAPYTFSWTPTRAQKGTTVQIEATITDSAGQVTTSDVSVPVVAAKQAVREAREEREARERVEAEAEEAIAAAEKELAEAKAAAEAAATESKAAQEKAAAELKAAEEKVEQAEKELEEAKKAAVSTSVGKVVKNTKKGTARLGVTVSGPGSLVVSGPGIVKVSGHPTSSGEVQVLIKAKGKALKTLKKKGKVSVKVTITFTAEGTKSTKTTTVVLVKK